MTVLLVILLLLTGSTIFWLCPHVGPNPMRKTGIRTAYAHRGLHGPDVPENSMAAFIQAANAGYAIELDVRLTADQVPVVIHDAATGRMCGTDLRIDQTPLHVLRSLRLNQSCETIPALEDVFQCIGGSVPLLIELKTNRDRLARKTLCRQVHMLLTRYPGFAAVESFDPRMMRYFKKNAPHIPRGQLISSKRGALPFLLRHLSPLFLCRPHFIACETGSLCLSLKIARLFRPALLVWTIRSAGEWQAVHHIFDQMVFEAFLPCADHNPLNSERGESTHERTA